MWPHYSKYLNFIEIQYFIQYDKFRSTYCTYFSVVFLITETFVDTLNLYVDSLFEIHISDPEDHIFLLR